MASLSQVPWRQVFVRQARQSFAGLDAETDYRRAKIFARPLMKRMMPGLNTDDVEEWMGTRPSFPDSLPCIDEVPGHVGLFTAFGHSHYGFRMAPNTGRVMAAAGGAPKTEYRHDPLSGVPLLMTTTSDAIVVGRWPAGLSHCIH